MHSPLLELRDISYTYDGEKRPVWTSLSCSFYEGKIYAIVGPSGCGKSSLLYLIDGLIPHLYEGQLSGAVYWEGEDITAVPPRRRCGNIGFVMQHLESQFCTFTVEEELAFGLENLGLPPEDIGRRIREVLAFVGMSGMEDRDLDTLSGGQKQKIAIASVLAMRPSVLLLDEPTANLDPQSRRQILDLVVRAAREEHTTVILVEHNIAEIAEHVDCVLSMNHGGEVVSEGAPEAAFLKAGAQQTTCLSLSSADVCDVGGQEPLIEVSDLSFAYPKAGARREKGQPVLQGLDMTIYRGDFAAILGENGAGKSTLFRLLFLVEKPDAGEIRIDGRSIEAYRPQALYRKMGLVFQNPEHQFVANTVYDEMMFSLKRMAIAREEKEARVDRMLRLYHLDGEKEKSPFALSQGQKRRLSVASMLLTQQEILFLDEPTYGQDEENRQELMREMQKLVREGVTVVMITHDLSLVRQYATRIFRMERGRMLEVSLGRDAHTQEGSVCSHT